MRYFFNFPKELTVEEKMLFLNQSLKITFVRHPFVRLVSTFQDKVIDTNYQNWRFALLKKPSYEEVIDKKILKELFYSQNYSGQFADYEQFN